MNCWNCKKEIELNPLLKIGFRAVCDHCNSYLHCCFGCEFYEQGRSNSCKIPGTDPIRDREASNLCDEFSPVKKQKSSPKSADNKFDDLFK